MFGLRNEKFSEFGVTDFSSCGTRLGTIGTKKKFALRKNKYLSNPIKESDAKAINGKQLHESMKSVFQLSLKQRCNVIAKEELITQIQILIYSIDDLELRMLVKDAFETQLLNKDFECQEFLDDLINQNYSKIYNC